MSRTIRTILFSLPLLPVVAALSSAQGPGFVLLPCFLSSPDAISQSDPVRTQIRLVSDKYDPLGGIVVLVQPLSGPQAVLTTGAPGWSNPFQVSVNEPLGLAYRQTVVAKGIAMGQLESVSTPAFSPLPPGAPAGSSLAWEYTRTQPVAVPVILEPGKGDTLEIFEKGEYGLWSIFTPPSGDFRFQAHVGVLVAEDEVRWLLAYHGRTAPVATYRTGIALHTRLAKIGPSGGPSGLLVRLDCEQRIAAHAATPILDAFHFSTSDEDVSGYPSLEASLVGWSEGQAFILVDGTLPPGWLVLALRDAGGDPGTIELLESQPPTFPGGPPSNAGIGPEPGAGSGAVAGAGDTTDAESTALDPLSRANHHSTLTHAVVTDCEPEPPNPPPTFTCTPVYTASRCASTVQAVGEKSCAISTVSTSDAVCLWPGQTTDEVRVSERNVSVSVSIGGVGGGYVVKTSSTSHRPYTATAGEHGLGQCYQTFLHALLCIQNGTVKADKYDIHWVETGSGTASPPAILVPCGGATRHTQLRCHKVMHTSNVCSRTP